MARLNILDETDSEDQHGNSNGSNQQLVQKVTTEVLKNITKKWTSEKEVKNILIYSIDFRVRVFSILIT